MQKVKYNLGSGSTRIPGYIPVDIKHGNSVYPLSVDDDSADVLRASHILEHFPAGEVADVLEHWVSKLRPGGILKIAVPDFEAICRRYMDADGMDFQGCVMGGQVDSYDFHKTIFDYDILSKAMTDAGLINISPWPSEIKDAAVLAISLNLMGKKPTGKKPTGKKPKIGAAMSVPRLGMMDNFFSVLQTLPPMGIQVKRHTGAFWGQCLERTMESWIKDDVDYILTIDYDTCLQKQDVQDLIDLAIKHPEADAIAPIQMSRSKKFPLMTVKNADGNNADNVSMESLQKDLLKVNTAHFGLTLIRVDALKKMAKPWFIGVPNSDGEWGEGRVDDDINFWRKWENVGNSIYIANRVTVGHSELMVIWPGKDLRPVYQHPTEFFESGKPPEVWV